MIIEEVYIADIIQSVCQNMQVQVPNQSVGTYFTINFLLGSEQKILDALNNMNGTSEDSLKYPLVAVVQPIPENNGSGFLEVTFPRIILAYLTQTSTKTEPVLDKYSVSGVYKTILRPMQREFIKNLAFSVYTSYGDPMAYEYTSRDIPCQQPIGSTLQDFVDIIEILNLKATIFPQIKTC